MQVGDRVRWVPTGQEGRVMELRDGGIISVFGEDGLGNWAIYDYADRFELVNECRVKPADVLDRAFDPEGELGLLETNDGPTHTHRGVPGVHE